MKLYLVQHAKAESKETNSERLLSDEGIAELSKISKLIDDKVKIEVSVIYHSGKARARQTAELLAGHISATEGIAEAGGLDPMADPAIWHQKLKRIEDDIMLVGHLPHLERLASLLVTGIPESRVIEFHNGGIVCLERENNSGWRLSWAVHPGLFF